MDASVEKKHKHAFWSNNYRANELISMRNIKPREVRGYCVPNCETLEMGIDELR
jgi:hypothetical protein